MLGVISDDVVLVFLLLTLNIFAGTIPSTFLLPLSTTGVRYRYLLPVYGSRNSIFIWVFKLKNAETLTTIFYSAFRIIKLFNNKYKIKDVVTAVLHNFYDAWVIYSSKVSGARSVSGLFSLLMCYHCSFAFYVNANSPFMLAKKTKKKTTTTTRSNYLTGPWNKVKKESALVLQILCISEEMIMCCYCCFFV